MLLSTTGKLFLTKGIARTVNIFFLSNLPNQKPKNPPD